MQKQDKQNSFSFFVVQIIIMAIIVLVVGSAACLMIIAIWAAINFLLKTF
jgi:hypothetical protein